MDETPVYFDMAGSTTINVKGAKTVQIQTTGNEKNQFICVLAITADGNKLPPMIIFKGVRTPANLPKGVVVCMHKKAWMDKHLMCEWIDQIWNKCPGISTASKPTSLLVMNSFEGHKTKSVRRKCNVGNTHVAIIPGGLTSVIQPLDVCINKLFKDRLREKWRLWMSHGNFELTKGENLKKPQYNLI